ncbi:MAG: carbohydrate-binding family 9-like protein [Bryobacterales bacterium]|nr:carbohydrate-binding family 9-like protein [Bryobacterales bacterium]
MPEREDFSNRFPVECARYTCMRTPAPITIDGDLTKPVWRAAPVSERFADMVTGKPAWFDTRVRLLWDDQYLYFGFTAEETDVWGTLTERDSAIYEENDLEIFIAAQDAYYEFEISACNVIYEVFWIWKDVHQPGGPFWGRPEFNPATQRTMSLEGVGGHLHPRGSRWGFLDWDCPGLLHAVKVDGTLNQRNDTDHGWSAEIAIPWTSLEALADGRALPPKPGDTWRIDCSRFQKIDEYGETLDPCAGWTWSQHGHYDSHIPEVFPYVTFTDEMVEPVEPESSDLED